jgi:Zn-dependent membrane protease YugP
MFFDPIYFLFVLPGLVFCLVAQGLVKSRFNKYSQIRNFRGMTGAQAAEAVLRQNGVAGVAILPCQGNLTDHFDPKTNRIFLSDGVFAATTIAAAGIAAHEAGHAVQYAKAFAPLKFRNAIIPMCNIGSRLAVPAIILGYFLGVVGLIWLGIALFSLAVVFQLITLPVEFDASRRALASLKASGTLGEQEADGAGKVLGAAALTYVAALMQSLLILLYYIFRANSRR